jgi:hypothetical protein
VAGGGGVRGDGGEAEATCVEVEEGGEGVMPSSHVTTRDDGPALR